MQEPSPAARAALRQYHDAAGLAPSVHERVWRDINASLDAAEQAPEAPTSEAPTPAPRRSRVLAWTLGASLAAAALLVVCNQRGHFTGPARPNGEAAQYGALPGADAEARAREHRSSPTLEHSDPNPSGSQTPAQLTRPRRASTGTANTAPSTDPVAPAGPGLAAEVALLRQARAALDANDPDAAMRVLGEHANDFRTGQMQQDRQRLRIEALCALGRTEAAHAEAETFLRIYPDSTHTARVRTLCRDPQ